MERAETGVLPVLQLVAAHDQNRFGQASKDSGQRLSSVPKVAQVQWDILLSCGGNQRNPDDLSAGQGISVRDRGERELEHQPGLHALLVDRAHDLGHYRCQVEDLRLLWKRHGDTCGDELVYGVEVRLLVPASH